MDFSQSCRDDVYQYHMYKMLPVCMQNQFVCRHIFKQLGTLFVLHSFVSFLSNVQLI